MKLFWFSYFLTVIFAGILGILAYIYLHPSSTDSPVSFPVPSALSRSQNDQVSSLSLFIPILSEVFATEGEDISLSAKSALLYDLETEQTLFSKNAEEKLPMASITKIMTAVIALENYSLTDEVLVEEDELVGENSMGLTSGERVSVNDLLYGLMLPSGNDAAEVLAHHFKGGRNGFVKAMNKKAAALGLSHTHFTNPSGLQGDGDQYTTAYDLLVITKYAVDTFPKFTEVTSTAEHWIPYTSSHKEFYLYNETNLITTYPGVRGVKTGYTPEAGLCLVTYLDYKGHRIIGVILGSENRRDEMKQLLDYSLKKLGVEPPAHG